MEEEDKDLKMSQPLFVELLDSLLQLLDNSLNVLRENDKRNNSTSDSRLPNVLTAKERKNIKNIGESFYEGIKTTYDKIREGISLREKMVGGVKKIFKLPSTIVKSTKNIKTKTEGFLKKLLLVVMILGVVYYLFKDWIDNKISALFGEGGETETFLSNVELGIKDSFSGILDVLGRIKKALDGAFGGEGFLNTLITKVTGAIDSAIKGALDGVADIVGETLFGSMGESMKDRFADELVRQLREEAEIAAYKDPSLRTQGELDQIIKYEQYKALSDISEQIWRGIDDDHRKNITKSEVRDAIMQAAMMAKVRNPIASDILGFFALNEMMKNNPNEFSAVLRQTLLTQSKGFKISDQDGLKNRLLQEVASLGKEYGLKGHMEYDYSSNFSTYIGPLLTEKGKEEFNKRYKEELAKLLKNWFEKTSFGNIEHVREFLSKSLNETMAQQTMGVDSKTLEEQNEKTDKAKELLSNIDFITEVKKMISIASLLDLISKFTSDSDGSFMKFADAISNTTREQIDAVIKKIMSSTSIVLTPKNLEGSVGIENKTDVVLTETYDIDQSTKAIINVSTIDVSEMTGIMENARKQEASIMGFLVHSTASIDTINELMKNYIKERRSKTSVTKSKNDKGIALTVIINDNSSTEGFNTGLSVTDRILVC